MNRRIRLVALLLCAVLLFEGCAMRTVEQMYSPPKRSDDYNYLQSAIDEAMSDLQYSAPLAGENRQVVQMADLDGDENPEYLLFARGNAEKPIQILIFRQVDDAYQLIDTIESNGAAFDQVEYVDIDDQPGVEIVVGRQVSDQVLRSVSVYTFARGEAEQLMTAGYTKFLTCDLNRDDRSELMLIHPGETDSDNGIAVLYHFDGESVERSAETNLSEPAASIKRIMVSKLQGNVPAVYVASAVDDSAIITDIFAIKDGKFTNISFSNESGTSVQTLRNYYVYADDLDDDGVFELPSLISMKSADSPMAEEKQYLIRWFTMDLDGREQDKVYSFHNYLGGWYMELDSQWADRVLVEQTGSTYSFLVWDESFTEAEKVFSVFALTGSNRDEQALENNRFILLRAEGVVYAANLEAASAAFAITQEDLISSFHLIQQDWKTGET